MFRKSVFTAAVFAASAFATVAISGGHSDRNPAVVARQSHMELYQHNLIVLGSMARGNVDYNADAAQAAATNIVKLTTLNQMSYWPPGTDNESIDGTRALPALWQNFPEVIAKATAVAEAALALEAAAGTGVEAMGAALGPLGQACTACHESFRQAD